MHGHLQYVWALFDCYGALEKLFGRQLRKPSASSSWNTSKATTYQWLLINGLDGNKPGLEPKDFGLRGWDSMEKTMDAGGSGGGANDFVDSGTIFVDDLAAIYAFRKGDCVRHVRRLMASRWPLGSRLFAIVPTLSDPARSSPTNCPRYD